MKLAAAIEWLWDLLRGTGQYEYVQRGEEARVRVGIEPTLRRAAFDRGEHPLPGASWPPARRTGWEQDEC
jgi:hypothetical protein